MTRDYLRYLRSPEWQARRRAVWSRAKGRCERCGAPGRDVHHLTYERVGAERLDDLRLLCRRCHCLAHRRWWCVVWQTLKKLVANLPLYHIMLQYLL